MSSRHLLEAFYRWQEEGESLVLATVYATSGSTYSKIGARMLITGDGRFQGMLSGGCLEGDLAERASQILKTGTPQAVTYDLRKTDDELWGLGVGCDGVMQIFLQALPKNAGYEPFASMARAWEGDNPRLAATIIDSRDSALAAGATLITKGADNIAYGMDAAATAAVDAEARKVLSTGQSDCRPVSVGGGVANVLFGMLIPPPRILVLGGGLDAVPLVNMAVELGWRVTVADHRPAYLADDRFVAADECICAPADSIAHNLRLASFQSVIIMSHHLVTDRCYLQQLAHVQIPYVGLLGPPARRERLLAELGEHGDLLRDRLHGPAGIDIAAGDPASIALSILAQMHQVLKRRY